MGMYDEVTCEYPLPDPEMQNVVFQTKDFDPCMEHYRITREGRLIHRMERGEHVPEQERPYWGTPEWNQGGLAQLCGCIRMINLGEEDLDFHGDLHFYTSGKNDEWYEYVARFTHGVVEWIKRVPACPKCGGTLWRRSNVQYACNKCDVKVAL